MGISENIKAIRRRYGLTQAQLGQIAGVSDKAVSTWEAGLKEPRMGAIQRISDHFGIPKGSIIEDGGLDQTIISLSPDEVMLIDLYRKLNNEGKSYIHQTMAMAVQSYSGKNNAASNMEAAK